MFDKIKKSLATETPFVVYAKPNKLEINGLFQRDNSLNYLEDFSKAGFVLAPFDYTQKSVFIPFEKSDFFQEKLSENFSEKLNSPEITYSENDKNKFEDLVKKMISEIKKGKISKMIASRTEDFYADNLDISGIYRKMFYNYTNTFRYCFYHPKIGVWIGATPEKLLSIEKNVFQTMAFAGTQKFEGKTDVIWQEKEIEEQQIVTDFIVDTLWSESETIKVSKPFTTEAGTLLHIQTDIEAKLRNGFSLKKIIEKLHPTPAVCGFPKDLSKEFILKNEGYNRSFYTGFLGELNLGQNIASEFYVNLRCMEIEDKRVRFYIGCGITKESVPEKEFFETVNKSATMKNVFLY